MHNAMMEILSAMLSLEEHVFEVKRKKKIKVNVLHN